MRCESRRLSSLHTQAVDIDLWDSLKMAYSVSHIKLRVTVYASALLEYIKTCKYGK